MSLQDLNTIFISEKQARQKGIHISRLLRKIIYYSLVASAIATAVTPIIYDDLVAFFISVIVFGSLLTALISLNLKKFRIASATVLITLAFGNFVCMLLGDGIHDIAILILPGALVMVVYSFSPDNTVRIHEAEIPRCDPQGAGVCENAGDCPGVETAATSELSAACSACYDLVADCSGEHCSGVCPGDGTGVCMQCETDAGCHTGFMECSGLHHLPPGSVTLPS